MRRFLRCANYTRNRSISTTSVHSASASPTSPASLTLPVRIDEMHGWLRERYPSFRARSQQIELLSNPADFHRRFIKGIEEAQRSIYISTLYIGEEQHEMIQLLGRRLRENGQLTLTILADYNRCTRNTLPQSPASLVATLVQEFGSRVRVYLYRPNTKLGIWEKLIPPRFNEGFGTQHTKIYCFDDSVLLSGANLNTSYFRDRQDRYMQIHEHPRLTEYLRAFVEQLTRFSHELSCGSSSSSRSSRSSRSAEKSESEGEGDSDANGASSSTTLERSRSRADTSKPPSYTLHWNNEAPASAFSSSAFTEMTNFSQSYRCTDTDADGDDGDTVIYPLIQSGLWGVREEEEAIKYLLEAVNGIPGSRVDVTSGYFSLGEEYKKRIVDSRVPTSIIAASPHANGFLGSRGVSGRIPEAYTHLESKFYAACVRHARNTTLALKEWRRDGWTYHCKGVWVRNDKDTEDSMATFIGSSNLSGRSTDLDLELSFLVFTHGETLKERLGEEVEDLDGNSMVVDESTFALPERKVSLFTRLLLWMGVDKML
ncbi:hypothetical protein E3P99_02785 [Wallemia hederae]|uniref:CDP-diacylglycerol--glycerol-3-phosphate 3-phosphatidyltransferase n=1 Tax=Wallemia hederae TaxID=1540922 RepID=A0A4T0FKD6_9BASI|nr:hypothetical protein E3P99_02785 [Wallemia hederae]